MTKISFDTYANQIHINWIFFKVQMKLKPSLRLATSVGLAVAVMFGFMLLPLIWDVNPFRDKAISGSCFGMAIVMGYCAYHAYREHNVRDEMQLVFMGTICLLISLVTLATSHFG